LPPRPASSAAPTHPLLLPAALWLVVVIAALTLRPLMPVDETCYMTVAWEMGLRHDWLVPHLNGATYAHKPPLLFWLINAVWAVLGVHEWSGRLVPPLFGLASLWMIVRLARLAWPDDDATARRAPLILAGMGGFAFYGTLATFDMMLTFVVLVGVEGALRAWRGAAWGWLVCGAALGLAILTKGPVALVHILPAPVLAPLWMAERPRGGWTRWYLALLGAVALGAAIGLAWAIPAARAGGPAYAAELLWGQTADRMVHAFAHREPVWWYLPLLPAILLPWPIVPSLWRAVRRRPDAGERLCIAWLAAALIVFSAISGKQAQYMLPEIVPAALLAARWLGGVRRLAWIAAAAPTLVVAAHIAFAARYAPRYDLTPAAAFLAQGERDGRPLAYPPDYEGEFNFLGRLTRPLAIVSGPDVVAWAKANPNGLLLVPLDPGAMPRDWKPVATFPDRDKTLTIWDAAAVIASDGKVMADRY